MRLIEAVSVTLDSSGDGVALFRQVPAGKVWLVERLSTVISGGSAANAILRAELKIFDGPALDQYYKDGTSTPWLDVSEYTTTRLVVFSPIQLRGVYEGCGPGETATLTLQGDETFASEQ